MFLCFPAGCGSRWRYPLNETPGHGVSQPTKSHLLPRCSLSFAPLSGGDTVGALICHLDFGLKLNICTFLVSGLCCLPLSQGQDSHATRSRHVTFCIFSNFKSPSYFFIKLFSDCKRFQIAAQSGNNQAIFAIAQNHFVFQIVLGFCLRMKCVFYTSTCACSCIDSYVVFRSRRLLI